VRGDLSVHLPFDPPFHASSKSHTIDCRKNVDAQRNSNLKN